MCERSLRCIHLVSVFDCSSTGAVDDLMIHVSKFLWGSGFSWSWYRFDLFKASRRDYM